MPNTEKVHEFLTKCITSCSREGPLDTGATGERSYRQVGIVHRYVSHSGAASFLTLASGSSSRICNSRFKDCVNAILQMLMINLVLTAELRSTARQNSPVPPSPKQARRRSGVRP